MYKNKYHIRIYNTFHLYIFPIKYAMQIINILLFQDCIVLSFLTHFLKSCPFYSTCESMCKCLDHKKGLQYFSTTYTAVAEQFSFSINSYLNTPPTYLK